jgi:hypothetical protein
MIGPKRIDAGGDRATPTPYQLSAVGGAPSDRAITARGPTVEIETSLARGDFVHALELAETLLGYDPENGDALRYAATARRELVALHLAKLGDRARVPRLLVAAGEIPTLSLDATAAFLMSRVDGRTTIDELVDLMPLSEHETLGLLVALLEGRILIV